MEVAAYAKTKVWRYGCKGLLFKGRSGVGRMPNPEKIRAALDSMPVEQSLTRVRGRRRGAADLRGRLVSERMRGVGWSYTET